MIYSSYRNTGTVACSGIAVPNHPFLRRSATASLCLQAQPVSTLTIKTTSSSSSGSGPGRCASPIIRRVCALPPLGKPKGCSATRAVHTGIDVQRSAHTFCNRTQYVRCQCVPRNPGIYTRECVCVWVHMDMHTKAHVFAGQRLRLRRRPRRWSTRPYSLQHFIYTYTHTCTRT